GSSDVCSSDLPRAAGGARALLPGGPLDRADRRGARRTGGHHQGSPPSGPRRSGQPPSHHRAHRRGAPAMTRTTDRDRNDDFTPQGWTQADDDLVRSALLSLREDVDTVPLADPSFIRARHGQARPRSRTLAWAAGAAAAAVVVAAVAFSQLGRPEAGPVTPATSTAVVSPPPTGATPEPTGEATQEATDPAPGSTVEPCGAVVGTVNQEGVSAAAGAKARTLMDAALECDSATLIALATDDQTELSFGVVSPEEAFDVANQRPEENRYALLSTLLTLRPQSDTQS